MKSSKIKTGLALGVLYLCAAVNPFAVAASSSGSACTKVGQFVTVNGQKLVCSLVWVAKDPGKVLLSTPQPQANSATRIGHAQSGGVSLTSITFKNSVNDDGIAITRIKNLTQSRIDGYLEITIFAPDGKTQTDWMQAYIYDGIASGATKTIDFTGGLPIPTGPFSYSFQATTF